MKAEIITIGDELLIGQVINTNQAYIAERLNAIGIPVERMTTAGDSLEAILAAFTAGMQFHDVIIVTGGLGPTHDDITRTAVCKFFSTDLVSNDEVRKHIEGLMKKRNMSWTVAAEDQTLVPRKATVIPNPIGTAPGMLFAESGKHFIVLPGVPYEMREMIDRTVIAYLAGFATGSVIRHRTLRTTGIAESLLALQIGNLEPVLGEAKLAFLPSPTGVRLRISAQAQNHADAERAIANVERYIRVKVAKYIYGVDSEELEEVVGRMLSERYLSIAVAESCTGGLIADRITDISGSSVYFDRGTVTYSNKSKIELLGVPPELIDIHGAVSKEVAEAMARGVRRVAGTDIGLSTTGIAGPTGGTPEKPVGLVWIGYADASTSLALRFNFGDDRRRTKERASQAALELVRRRLLKIE